MGKELRVSHGAKDFDKAEFGKRLRQKRKSAGFRSQESFAEKYDELYNTDGQKSILNSVKKYEGGKSAPNPETLLRICKVLGNCDAGFLLGLYDESKKGIHDIAALTGLSETAIKELTNPVSQFNKETAIQPFLNAILSSPYSQRIAMGYSEFIVNRAMYQNSNSRHNNLMGFISTNGAFDAEDFDLLNNPAYLKKADYDRMKHSEYLLFQCLTEFLDWVSEGGDVNGKEET